MIINRKREEAQMTKINDVDQELDADNSDNRKAPPTIIISTTYLPKLKIKKNRRII